MNSRTKILIIGTYKNFFFRCTDYEEKAVFLLKMEKLKVTERKYRIKVFISFLIFIMIVFAGCARRKFNDEARTMCRDMTLEQKIGQMIMMAVPGDRMNQAAELILKRYRPGGVILFGYNLNSFERNKNFIQDMQDASYSFAGIPLFISIDQEGGRVARIVSGVTQFPGAMAAGVSGDRDLAYRWGRIVGVELRMTGVNMNLAPVLDVNNNPRNPVINTRSFGSDPGLVADLGAAYIKGIQDSRCIAVGKHFPGHGDTDKDSHLTLPVIRYGMERLSRIELVPFKRAIRSGVECIMSAHVAYPAILGSDEPATESKMFLSDILRKQFDFDGLVITDDMEMHAISRRQEMGEAAVRSVLAGADIILISSYEKNIGVIIEALLKAVREKRISEERINDSVVRILETKMRYGILVRRDGSWIPGTYVLSDDDKKTLNESASVSASLSQKGILCFGGEEFVMPASDAVRIFITRSDILRREMSKNANHRIISDFSELGRLAVAHRERMFVYLHVVEPDLEHIRNVAGFCKKTGIHLVLVSSGNPFPVTVSGIVRAGLLSFSNTDESVRQLGRCLNGEFRPRTGGSLFLGIENQKP
jgi:beta-N-acetylhexosaminidase